MALNYAHGVIQWDADAGVNTTFTVSGLSFQPKALRFVTMGFYSATDAIDEARDDRRSVGFATSTTSRRCVTIYDDDGAATMLCGVAAFDDCIAARINGTPATEGKLDLNAINSDGFQLIVDVDPGSTQDLIVFWEAWGGTDIDVAAVLDITEPSATGNQSYTVTGFTSDGANQVLMFAGCQSASALNSLEANDAGLCIGHATGTAAGQQHVVAVNQQDGAANANTDRYGVDDECLAMIAIGGGNPDARAALNAWQTDGFQLNWIARATTGRRYICLAIKGGQWRAGSLAINDNGVGATGTVSGLPFQPIGLSVLANGTSEQTAGTSTTHSVLTFGTGTSTTSRRAHSASSIDGGAAAVVSSVVEHDEIYVTSASGAVVRAIDLNAINSDGFQLIVDVSSANASVWVAYLTFASEAAGAVLEGTAALAVSTAGALTTQITLAGSSALAISTAGALTTQIALAGSSLLAVDTAAALTTQIALAGSANLVVDAAGLLSEGAIALVGSSTLAITTAADLTTQILLAGAADLSIDATGVLSAPAGTIKARLVLRGGHASPGLQIVLTLQGTPAGQAYQANAYQAGAYQTGSYNLARRRLALLKKARA